MNYLIVKHFSGREIPFVFPETVAHADMRDQLPYGDIISAGVVCLGANGFVCTGGDKELGIAARPEKDAAVIENALRERD
jgi:hypothetical protein